MSVVVPTSLDDALDALAAHPDAHLLAGGTDLMVEVNFGHRRPEHVISIGRLPELRTWSIDLDAGAVRIGAAVTYAELMASDVAVLVPALAEASRTVGSPQIRNAGTLGGNLGTCSPAGDTLPVLAALGATVELASSSGRRRVPIGEFMVGPKRNTAAPGELVCAVEVPVIDGWQGFAKVGTRNAMVIAVCNAALVVDRSLAILRVAMGSVGPTVLRAEDAEAWLADRVDWDALRLVGDAGDGSGVEGLCREFGDRCAAVALPIDDHRSTADYRRHAVGVLAGRLARRAFIGERAR
ncbi:MAG: FAD binding domain-containing protein [Acidimicrobiales bacterium]